MIHVFSPEVMLNSFFEKIHRRRLPLHSLQPNKNELLQDEQQEYGEQQSFFRCRFSTLRATRPLTKPGMWYVLSQPFPIRSSMDVAHARKITDLYGQRRQNSCHLLPMLQKTVRRHTDRAAEKNGALHLRPVHPLYPQPPGLSARIDLWQGLCHPAKWPGMPNLSLRPLARRHRFQCPDSIQPRHCHRTGSPYQIPLHDRLNRTAKNSHKEPDQQPRRCRIPRRPTAVVLMENRPEFSILLLRLQPHAAAIPAGSLPESHNRPDPSSFRMPSMDSDHDSPTLPGYPRSAAVNSLGGPNIPDNKTSPAEKESISGKFRKIQRTAT